MCIPAVFALFVGAPFSFPAAQIVEVKPKAVISQDRQEIRIVSVENAETAEKSIAVDAKVNINLRVCEGNLKINGWERNEIRAFVSGGHGVGFEILQKNQTNGNPIWVKILGFDRTKKGQTAAEECLSGDEIELDVPRGAIVSVKSSESETTIDSVRKVTIENVGGDIFLNNITAGIEAKTYEGDVTVENSSGAITLSSMTGNIVAFNLSPEEIGDVFNAKTSSGAIVLQKIEHRQAEAVSTSGSIRFAGNFQNGGQYGLRTQNGSILLALPEKSSFKLNASLGFGKFNSEIPLENLVRNADSKTAQSVSASLGKGEATVNLTTYSGAIRIRKQ